MTLRQPFIAVILWIALPCWGFADDGQETKPADQAATGNLFGDISARADGDPALLSLPSRDSQWDARFGWWGMWTHGSQAKTGEYQDMNSSPFFDIDGLASDGNRTLGLTITGNDNDTDQGDLYYYQNGFSAKIDYERFLHQLDHDPLNNIPGPNAPLVSPPPPLPANPKDPKIIKQDLNVGQDYALRVQELNASFKKQLTDDLQVRLDVWGQEKDGTRQVNAVAMCYTNEPVMASPTTCFRPTIRRSRSLRAIRCHVLSQAQVVDWTTTEIKPVVQWRVGDAINIEYSRPMRNFSADDSLTTRYYDRTGDLSYSPGPPPPGTVTNRNPYAYAVVPDSVTSMDQLKISSDLTEDTHAYAYLMNGTTTNETNHMDRWFNDVDMRITNTSIRNVSITGVCHDLQRVRVVGRCSDHHRGKPGATGQRRRKHPSDALPSGRRHWRKHRLPPIHGRNQGRLASLRRRLYSRWPGDCRRLRVLRSRTGKRDLRSFVRQLGVPRGRRI